MDLVAASGHREEAFVHLAYSLGIPAMGDTGPAALWGNPVDGNRDRGIRLDRVVRMAARLAEQHKSEHQAAADTELERQLRSMGHLPKNSAAEAVVVAAGVECRELVALWDRRTVATSKPAVVSAVRLPRTEEERTMWVDVRREVARRGVVMERLMGYLDHYWPRPLEWVEASALG